MSVRKYIPLCMRKGGFALKHRLICNTSLWKLSARAPSLDRQQRGSRSQGNRKAIPFENMMSLKLSLSQFRAW